MQSDSPSPCLPRLVSLSLSPSHPRTAGMQRGRHGHANHAHAAAYRPCGPELAPGHRVSRPRGTESVGDSVGEGTLTRLLFSPSPHAHCSTQIPISASASLLPVENATSPPPPPPPSPALPPILMPTGTVAGTHTHTHGHGHGHGHADTDTPMKTRSERTGMTRERKVTKRRN
jgi:hypothetical protein